MRINKTLTNHLIAKKIIPIEDKEIYDYGFEMLFSTILGYIIVLLTAYIMNSILEGLIFLVSFIFLRNFSGGYHANTHVKCNLFLFLSALFVLFMSKVSIPYIYLILIYILLLAMIFEYAPIENENKPLTGEEKMKYKKVAICTTLVIGIMSFILYGHYIVITRVLILTCFMVALLMAIVVIDNN